MNIDNAVFMMAGTVALIFSALVLITGNTLWAWGTVFVGANLLQSSITGWCPAAKIFAALGLKSGTAFKGKDV